MPRLNDKKYLIDYDNVIQKSNQFSMAKMSHGLSLNQMQLLAFAIYSTQKDGTTAFNKAQFEKKFDLSYKTLHAKDDTKKLYELGFSIEDLGADYFEYQRIFQRISYKKGLFEFKWAEDMIPHILHLKERHTTIDLTITSKFRSAFSWTLYDYLKSHYGYWHKEISKIELMKLFGVEDKKTYLNNTGRLKSTVLDVAISELNDFTDLEVWYVERKKGKAIVAFDLHWSMAKKIETAASEKQFKELHTMVDAIENDMWNYLDVVDGIEEQELQMMKKIKTILKYREEIVPTMTSTKANDLIKTIKMHIKSLEVLLKNVRQLKEMEEQPNYAPFYNWLEERE